MVDGRKGGWIEVSDGLLMFNVMTITTATAVCGGKVEEDFLVGRYGSGGLEGTQ
jgi:hypothetical protein